jgi:dTDP-4-amino-4,6-dideoxygalactose transaminase
MLYYNKQSISDIDIRYVSRALKKNILTRGQLNVEFEKNICEKTKSNYSVSFNSASSALTAACFALGLKKDDLVWTVPNTFVSTASCALHFSAKIDFVDIDNKYKIMCVDKLEEKLIRSEKIKKLPKILIPVHYAGQATNQEKIFKLSKKYGFKVLEDASHSFGGMRDSEPVGSCKWSDIVVSSFHPVKTITTGEGGVACTNSKELDFRLQIYRNNGIIRDYRFLKKKTKEKFYYEQQCLGHNFHLPDINAALGISQLKRLKKFINKRKKIFNYYNKNINNKNLILPSIDEKNNSTHHLYVCNLKNGIDRKKVLSYFYKNKITLNVLYIPVHLHPIYYKKGFRKGDYPNSEWHYNTSVALPIYYDLSKKNLDKIINLLNKIKI